MLRPCFVPCDVVAGSRRETLWPKLFRMHENGSTGLFNRYRLLRWKKGRQQDAAFDGAGRITADELLKGALALRLQDFMF